MEGSGQKSCFNIPLESAKDELQNAPKKIKNKYIKNIFCELFRPVIDKAYIAYMDLKVYYIKSLKSFKILDTLNKFKSIEIII